MMIPPLPSKLDRYTAFYGTVFLDDAVDSVKAGLKVVYRLKQEQDYECFREVRKKTKKVSTLYAMFYRTPGEQKWGISPVWFLGYSVSSTAGAKVRFEISPDDKEKWQYFRGCEPDAVHQLLLLELDDQSKYVDQAKREKLERAEGHLKGGKLARHAGRLCGDDHFIKWVGTMVADVTPAQFIYNRCSINSRRYLDHNEDAAKRYHQFVRKPFSQWLVASGIN